MVVKVSKKHFNANVFSIFVCVLGTNITSVCDGSYFSFCTIPDISTIAAKI